MIRRSLSDVSFLYLARFRYYGKHGARTKVWLGCTRSSHSARCWRLRAYIWSSNGRGTGGEYVWIAIVWTLLLSSCRASSLPGAVCSNRVPQSSGKITYYLTGKDKQKIQRKLLNIFLPLNLNIYFGCSKEPSHWDGSFEYPQHMFWLE